MSETGKQRQAAIKAVARHFSATWEPSGDAFGATLSIAGQRIAVAVAMAEYHIAERADFNRPRLRFDKVARGLIARLQDALSQFVPDGMAVILTVTAPIRLPAKTAEALGDTIRDCLARRPLPVEIRDAVCGNQVRLRVVAAVARPVSKVIGFVHNSDSDTDILLDIAQSLLRQVGAAGDARASAGSEAERRLVVVIAGGFSHGETYRQVYAALSIATDFAKVLMVYPSGRVETLHDINMTALPRARAVD
jgi:hypothetical protein